MSLIKCMECGKEYSTKAHTCPNCGCPTWDTINEICRKDKCIIICREPYDVSEILSNIDNGVDDQISIDAIANSISESTNTAYHILEEIKNNNFLPWYRNQYGILTNQKLEEKLERERQQIAQQRENVPHCPNCNSTNIKRISTTSRMLSGLTLGILSSNVGKTFKCNNCGYKW